MSTLSTEKTPKKRQNFICNECNFSCSRKCDYIRHISTLKHKKSTKSTEKRQKSVDFICECGKEYKERTGLYKHKKVCEYRTTMEDANMSYTKIDSNMVLELIRQNKELQKQMFELAQTKSDVTIHNNNHTNNNNTNNRNTNNFNISVFLNEHCKNAINFSDFINNIQVSREDLQNNAQLGFVGGISKIITDNLKLLTVHERPIHCTDIKRETMYIRDDNSWKKDKDFVQETLNRAIQEVSRKSVISLMEWKQTNPDYKDMDSDFSNLCLVMHQQSIAGYDRDKFYPKVIRRIAESVPCKGH